MSMISIWILLLSNAAAFALGYFLNRCVIWKGHHMARHGDMHRPSVKRWTGGRMLGIVVGLLAIISVTMTAYANYEQEQAFNRQQECNDTINEAIAYRSRIAEEDQQLNIDARKNTSYFNINFGRLAVASGDTQNNPEAREKARQEFSNLYDTYLTEEKRIVDALESNQRDRQARPVPTINCEDQ